MLWHGMALARVDFLVPFLDFFLLLLWAGWLVRSFVCLLAGLWFLELVGV